MNIDLNPSRQQSVTLARPTKDEIHEIRLMLDEQQPPTWEDFHGHDAELKKMKARAELIAPLAQAIVITGPVGVGKSIVARIIASTPLSQDGDHAIEDSVVTFNPLTNAARTRSTSFNDMETGNIRGVTTMQKNRYQEEHSDKRYEPLDQAFTEARGSTLIIRNAECLPFFAQAQISNCINDAFSAEHSPARIILLMNQSLHQCIQGNLLLPELGALLRPLELQVPPITQTPLRLKSLATNLLHLEAARRNKDLLVSEDALKELASYLWPGNLRELQSVISLAVSLTKKEIVERDIIAALLPKTGILSTAPAVPASQPQDIVPEEVAALPSLRIESMVATPLANVSAPKSVESREQKEIKLSPTALLDAVLERTKELNLAQAISFVEVHGHRRLLEDLCLLAFCAAEGGWRVASKKHLQIAYLEFQDVFSKIGKQIGCATFEQTTSTLREIVQTDDFVKRIGKATLVELKIATWNRTLSTDLLNAQLTPRSVKPSRQPKSAEAPPANHSSPAKLITPASTTPSKAVPLPVPTSTPLSKESSNGDNHKVIFVAAGKPLAPTLPPIPQTTQSIDTQSPSAEIAKMTLELERAVLTAHELAEKKERIDFRQLSPHEFSRRLYAAMVICHRGNLQTAANALDIQQGNLKASLDTLCRELGYTSNIHFIGDLKALGLSFAVDSIPANLNVKMLHIGDLKTIFMQRYLEKPASPSASAPPSTPLPAPTPTLLPTRPASPTVTALPRLAAMQHSPSRHYSADSFLTAQAQKLNCWMSGIASRRLGIAADEIITASMVWCFLEAKGKISIAAKTRKISEEEMERQLKELGITHKIENFIESITHIAKNETLGGQPIVAGCYGPDMTEERWKKLCQNPVEVQLHGGHKMRTPAALIPPAPLPPELGLIQKGISGSRRALNNMKELLTDNVNTYHLCSLSSLKEALFWQLAVAEKGMLATMRARAKEDGGFITDFCPKLGLRGELSQLFALAAEKKLPVLLEKNTLPQDINFEDAAGLLLLTAVNLFKDEETDLKTALKKMTDTTGCSWVTIAANSVSMSPVDFIRRVSNQVTRLGNTENVLALLRERNQWLKTAGTTSQVAHSA